MWGRKSHAGGSCHVSDVATPVCCACRSGLIRHRRMHDGILGPLGEAQQKPIIKVSSLTLPVFNPLVWNVMKARGLDVKNGFELDIKAYPSISGFYAAFATGETDVLIGGPTILQKLYQEGVPLRIIGTGFTLVRPRDLRQGPGDQVAGRSQGQATRDRHGRLAIPGRADLRQRQGHRPRQGHHRGQRELCRRARAARGRAGRCRAGDRAAGQHHHQAESGLARHLQRRAGLEGNHRRGWLGARAGHARGRDRSACRTRRR